MTTGSPTPCPRCNGEAGLALGLSGSFVLCGNCGLRTACYMTDAKALAAWVTDEPETWRVELMKALKQAALDLHEAAGRFMCAGKINMQACSEMTREAARRIDAEIERLDRGNA